MLEGGESEVEEEIGGRRRKRENEIEKVIGVRRRNIFTSSFVDCREELIVNANLT